ncbi:calcium-binding protein [Salipiger sp.]|uniref:calcium-binding protein n=1 Tax=Salipiger sp. TaxID=2078585 RepID=UPI003A9734CA
MPDTPLAWWSQFQVNTQDAGPTSDAQYAPVTIELSTGYIVVLWLDESDSWPAGNPGTEVVGQLFDPLGNKVGDEFLASDGTTSEVGYPFDAVALPGGRFAVVYTDTDMEAFTYALKVTEWTIVAGGIGPSTTMQIPTSAGPYSLLRCPSVAAQADGSYLVAYEHVSGFSGVSTVRAVRVATDGAMGSEIVLLSAGQDPHWFTDVAALGNGDYVVVSGNGVFDDMGISYRLTNGTSAFGDETAVADTATNEARDDWPSVVALSGGGFVISWSNDDLVDYDVAFQRFDSAGAPLGGVTPVNDLGDGDRNVQSHLIALADGGFVFSFEDSAASRMSLRRFDATGVAVGNMVTIDSGGEGDPNGIGLADGRFVVSWTSRRIGSPGDVGGSGLNVRAQIYDTRDAWAPPGPNQTSNWQVGTIFSESVVGGDGDDVLHGWLGSDTVRGGGGSDTIYGGHDNLFGDDGNDFFIVHAGALDHVDGGAGVDALYARDSSVGINIDMAANLWNNGRDTCGLVSIESVYGTRFADHMFAGNISGVTLMGWGGNDTLIGGDFHQALNGEDGDDLIYGGGGHDDLFGVAGADTIFGGTGNDVAYGGAGSDSIFGDAGDDTLSGASENDTLYGGTGSDDLSGGDGNDALRGDDGADTLRGDEGNDLLIGGGNTDSLLGGGGRDTLQGNLGNDTMEGGAGNDSAVGGDGRDLVRGDDGNDTLQGNKANDTLDGGAGNDSLLGGDDNDSLLGGSGADTVSGGSGNDYIEGNGEADSLAGNAGLDTLLGGLGNDTLNGGSDGDLMYGEDGNDWLDGSDGADTLYGGNGTDTLVGGAGNDRLFGGAGPDTFVFAGVFGNDSIQGFATGSDRIQMTGIPQASLTLSASGGNTLVEVAGQADTILIVGTVLTDFSDFVFV